jgi:hypothetical protein
MITPVMAGPTTRLMLTPTLLMATAEERAGDGTSSGTIACQAGVSSAASVPSSNMKSSSTPGPTACSMTSNANNALRSVVATSSTSISRRLSSMSASAPAGNANRNNGRLLATCTSETMKGLGSRLVISQPEAALYIQLPTFDTTVAIHSQRNTG